MAKRLVDRILDASLGVFTPLAIGAVALGVHNYSKNHTTIAPISEPVAVTYELPAEAKTSSLEDHVGKPSFLEERESGIEKIAAKTDVKEGKDRNYPIGPNKDYSFLISNDEFTDSGYVDQKQIQNYLESNNYALAKKINGKLFSEEVCSLAKKHSINPLLLLARAQVEKSAVKKQNLSEKQLNEIMGYDIPDSGRRRKASLGFSTQIEKSARCLKRHYDNFEEGKSVKINYGESDIVPKNAGTYSLFRYTPHTIDIKLHRKGGGNDLVMNVYKGFRKEIRSYKK